MIWDRNVDKKTQKSFGRYSKYITESEDFLTKIPRFLQDTYVKFDYVQVIIARQSGDITMWNLVNGQQVASVKDKMKIVELTAIAVDDSGEFVVAGYIDGTGTVCFLVLSLRKISCFEQFFIMIRLFFKKKKLS